MPEESQAIATDSRLSLEEAQREATAVKKTAEVLSRKREGTLNYAFADKIVDNSEKILGVDRETYIDVQNTREQIERVVGGEIEIKMAHSIDMAVNRHEAELSGIIEKLLENPEVPVTSMSEIIFNDINSGSLEFRNLLAKHSSENLGDLFKKYISQISEMTISSARKKIDEATKEDRNEQSEPARLEINENVVAGVANPITRESDSQAEVLEDDVEVRFQALMQMLQLDPPKDGFFHFDLISFKYACFKDSNKSIMTLSAYPQEVIPDTNTFLTRSGLNSLNEPVKRVSSIAEFSGQYLWVEKTEDDQYYIRHRYIRAPETRRKSEPETATEYWGGDGYEE